MLGEGDDDRCDYLSASRMIGDNHLAARFGLVAEHPHAGEQKRRTENEGGESHQSLSEWLTGKLEDPFPSRHGPTEDLPANG